MFFPAHRRGAGMAPARARRSREGRTLCLLEPSAEWRQAGAAGWTFRSKLIRAAGLKGMGGMQNCYATQRCFPRDFWDSEKIIATPRFDVAFGVGGYASGPMILAARASRRIPDVVFEPNVEPGFTNRILAGIATRVPCGFEETAERFGRKGGRHGHPGSPRIFRRFAARTQPATRASFNILITGGSRGALADQSRRS